MCIFLFIYFFTEERNDWVCCIEKILSDRKHSLEPRNLFFRNGSVNISLEGYLEMLSPRTKVTLVSKDKLFFFRSHEEYFQGLGITDLDMRMANVRDGENKRSFTLTTPYRAFSFLVDSESLKQRWCEALKECVCRALSCDGLCESIWRVPSNRLCADCSSSMPEWASINLCVLLCEKCADVHRSLGQNVSKVRILKLDERVWTDDLIRAVLPPALFDVSGTCDRLGRLRCTEGNHGIGWFCLSTFKLQVLLEDNVQTMDLRKLLTLRLISSGIYRKSGINSHVTKLLERFQKDARSVTLHGSDYSVDDVANMLKRFLREVKDGVFNGQENSDSWLRAAGLEDRSEKIHRYQILLSNLPEVNRNTQSTHLPPGLTDGADVTGSQVVEELIQNYCSILNVSESDLQRQLNMTSDILNKHKSQRPLSRTPSSTVCAVYLEKKDEGAVVLVQIAADMTVAKLVSVVLELKRIQQASEEF
ncbi:hypothetical protein cypCar_00031121 [Cyprinus carpio]|nr:hypothetical protein cypCar_00031121 [Cyprinus carpio]